MVRRKIPDSDPSYGRWAEQPPPPHAPMPKRTPPGAEEPAPFSGKWVPPEQHSPESFVSTPCAGPWDRVQQQKDAVRRHAGRPEGEGGRVADGGFRISEADRARQHGREHGRDRDVPERQARAQYRPPRQNNDKINVVIIQFETEHSHPEERLVIMGMKRQREGTYAAMHPFQYDSADWNRHMDLEPISALTWSEPAEVGRQVKLIIAHAFESLMSQSGVMVTGLEYLTTEMNTLIRGSRTIRLSSVTRRPWRCTTTGSRTWWRRSMWT